MPQFKETYLTLFNVRYLYGISGFALLKSHR